MLACGPCATPTPMSSCAATPSTTETLSAKSNTRWINSVASLFDSFLIFLLLNRQWIPEARHFCPNVPIVLVGTKHDLRENQREDGESADGTSFASASINEVAYDEVRKEPEITIFSISSPDIFPCSLPTGRRIEEQARSFGLHRVLRQDPPQHQGCL